MDSVVKRKKKENAHVSFTERDGMRNKRVNQRRVWAEKKLSMPIQEDV